jgi:hypothetical protein
MQQVEHAFDARLTERARAPHRGIGQALFLRQDISVRQQRTGREILQETTAGCGLTDHTLPDREPLARL